MRRLKIGIRPQLILLVAFSSLFSLLILAIVTGVHFSDNLSNLRAERLEVISQLKATQVTQAVQYMFYQVYWLSQKNTVSDPLSSYRAGNNTEGVFVESQVTIDQFLATSELFVGARLYNLDLDIVAQGTNDLTIISEPTRDYLYPLLKNATIPPVLLSSQQYDESSDSDFPAYVSGPMSNNSWDYSAYFIGITLPVTSNSSIVFDKPSVSGYLTVLANAQNIYVAINDTQSFGSEKNTKNEYSILAVQPIYSDNNGNTSQIVGFESLFPADNADLIPNYVYNINSSSSVKKAFGLKYGSSSRVKSSSGSDVAIGFTRLTLNSRSFWTIIVEQSRKNFYAPVANFRDIIIGVVIGIGAFMCLVTFPLAVMFVRPITILKEATEAITTSKKKRHDKHNSTILTASPTGANDDRRGSALSEASTSYSTGIRLPEKILHTKKFFKDELTELSDAFNIMTAELDRQYATLEDRVRSRTKELEALKIQAESANEAKTVFIANISHELRTPLNGILGMTSIAMEEQDPSRIKESLQLIHRSGELLLHILTELLTYSKNTLNRSKLEKSEFQILEVVYQVQSIFSKLANDQRVNLMLWLKPSIIRKLVLVGDSNRIIQIVMNLVSNSLKFTPVGSAVDVQFKLLGEYDERRSKACKNTQVFVKRFPHSVSMGKFDPEETPTATPTDQEAESTIANGDTNPKSSKSSPEDISDNTSIFTLSTAEYDKAIFESQFETVKPLPSLPDHASDKPRSIAEESMVEFLRGDKRFRMRKLRRPKNWVLQIVVTDTGPGIEPALQEKVFEPFVQGDQTLSRSYGGTGLGLSICRQLAKMMNGTLTLDSTLGVGSTFILTIPLPQTREIIVDDEDMEEFCNDDFNPKRTENHKDKFVAEEDTPSSKKDTLSTDSSDSSKVLRLEVPRAIKPHLITRGSTGTANSGENGEILTDLSHLKILVAEDNMVNQEVIKRMLKLEGFPNITMACNGAEAVEMVKHLVESGEDFDIIFMDVQMPQIDGLLATKMIRSNLKWERPIIALTAFADESNVKECLNAGMSGFLAKPIKRSNLKKIIREFSPRLLSETVLTPPTHPSEDKRLGY